MIRKQEIVNAAREYIDTVMFSLPSDVIYFEAGAEWADEHPINVWHEPSEEPEGDYCDILHQDENGCCWMESKADVMRLYDTWNEFIEIETIIRWAYVSDLLPKGGKQ